MTKAQMHYKIMDGEENSNSSCLEGSESKDINRIYYFESDHLALRGNSDYHKLLHTVGLLEAQRSKAVHDFDALLGAQKKALADPIAFVEKLQKGDNLDLPKPQKIAEIPYIDWEQYTSGIDSQALHGHKHMTRHKKSGDGVAKEHGHDNPSNHMNQTADTVSGSDVVRGRIKGEQKPATFNQLWTSQEQKRLEELLVEFPPEEVEMRRWEKIAKALGNRTTQQVASRVQKYFIKLAKAGLPVPGRIPNLGALQKKQSHRHQRHNRLYWRPSTFLSSHQPPVYMSDDGDEDDDASQSESCFSGDIAIRGSTSWDAEQNDDEDDDIAPELHNTPEYKELVRLRRLRKQKLQEDILTNIQHIGYKCDGCGCEPITGTRWTCIDCKDESVDFCHPCADRGYETETHNSSHRLTPVKCMDSVPHVDSDYTRFMQGGYNYLDPNYMPAT